MRRFQALLLAAGLATAPTSAVAGPSPDHADAPATVETLRWSMSKGRLGVMVMGLTPELRRHYGAGADRGVLVGEVEPGTPAAMAGLAVGDVIVEVRGRAIDDATDVVSALADAGTGDRVAVKVVRDKVARTIDVEMTADAPPAIGSLRRGVDGWPRWMRDLMRGFDRDDADAPAFGPPRWWRRFAPERPCTDT